MSSTTSGDPKPMICNVPYRYGEHVDREVLCMLPFGHDGWHQHSDDKGSVRWSGPRKARPLT